MKAIVLNQNTYRFEIKEVDKALISTTDVLIKLKAASINHHELWTKNERNLKSSSDIILGSDGAGLVEELGSSVQDLNIGDEVIINPSINWGTNKRVQAEDYEILGFPTQGTFAEYISIDQEYVYPKPKHLSFHEAAAIPLAGLTAYRALFTRGELEPDSKVLITGIGGGAALFALNFALANGNEVYVSSGDGHKIKKAISMGAKGGVNYKNKNWKSELKENVKGFDVIIDSAAGEGFTDLTELANPGARIVLFGRTAGNIPNLNPKTIFWKQLSIHGTTMGTKDEFKKMMNLFTSKNIRPVLDSIYLPHEVGTAFDKMNKGLQFGKIILQTGKFT